MKQCPNCRTSYTDDTLKFCLQDGTPLAPVSDSDVSTPTVAFDNEETVMSSRRVEPIRVELPGLETANQQPSQERFYPQQPTHERVSVTPPSRKSNTGLIVLLTALVTLLVLGGAGAAYLFMQNRTREVAVNVNTAPRTNRPLNANSAGNESIPANNKEANAATPTPSPTATPTPKPTVNPETAKAVTENVRNVIDDWKSASENLDLDGHLSQYAETVDYYNAGKVGLARVRADKQKAFEAYDSINFDISNIRVTPDPSGEKATAIFDKQWTFEGAEKRSSGKVQQLLTFAKINGRWLITGERDLKVYYKD